MRLLQLVVLQMESFFLSCDSSTLFIPPFPRSFFLCAQGCMCVRVSESFECKLNWFCRLAVAHVLAKQSGRRIYFHCFLLSQNLYHWWTMIGSTALCRFDLAFKNDMFLYIGNCMVLDFFFRCMRRFPKRKMNSIMFILTT